MTLQIPQIIGNKINSDIGRPRKKGPLAYAQIVDKVTISEGAYFPAGALKSVEHKFGPLSQDEKQFISQCDPDLVEDFAGRTDSKQEFLQRLTLVKPLAEVLKKRKGSRLELLTLNDLWTLSSSSSDEVSQWQNPVWIDALLNHNRKIFTQVKSRFGSKLTLDDYKLINKLGQELPFFVLPYFLEHAKSYEDLVLSLRELSSFYDGAGQLFEKEEFDGYSRKIFDRVSSPKEYLKEMKKLAKYFETQRPAYDRLIGKQIDLDYFWEKSGSTDEFCSRLDNLYAFFENTALNFQGGIEVLGYGDISANRSPFNILLRYPEFLGNEELWRLSGLVENEQLNYLGEIADAAETYQHIKNKSIGEIGDNELKKVMLLPQMRVIVTEDIAPLLNNDCYLNYLRKNYPDFNLGKLFSLTIAFQRNLKAMGFSDREILSLDTARLDLHFSRMMAANNYVFGLNMVGPGINVIIMTAHPENGNIGDFHFNDIFGYAEKYGSNIIFAKNGGGGNKAEFLEAIKSAKGPTTVFIMGHGNGFKISYGGKSEKFSHEELIMAVAQNENPQDVIIFISSCNAYTFVENFEQLYPKDIPMPVIISQGGNKGMSAASGSGSWVFDGEKVKDFYAVFDDKFFKAWNHGSVGNSNSDAFIRLDWRYYDLGSNLKELFKGLRQPRKIRIEA